MNKIGKISVKRHKKTAGGNTMRDSLTGAGLNRIPNAIVPWTPFKELDGSYRTGLDVNAPYIRRMEPEQRETEVRIVKELREKAEEFFGSIDLSSRADFYTKMFENYGRDGVCTPWHMKDGDNLFNMSNPLHLITYAWLRVHPFVAPSGAALSNGKYANCKYYVNDYDVETSNNFNTKSRITDALRELSSLAPTRLRQISRQCGFSVTDVDTEESVFVRLYDFINEAATTGVNTNLRLFEAVTGLTQEDLDVRDVIKQGFIYGVFRNFKNAIYRGETRVAANEDELLANLTGMDNEDDFLGVEQELKVKRSKIH